MITLTCDKCNKPFETEDDAAGGKVECPYCGDINRVPSAGVAASVAARKGVVKAQSDSVEPEGEQVIAVIRQAMFRAHPFWYLLMVMILLFGIALAVVPKSKPPLALEPWLMWAGLVLVIISLLWWFIWWAAPHRWIKLTITNRRTIRQEGIIVRKTSEVLHDHIRNVKIEQTVMQRLLGVGSIWIDSAGGTKDQSVEIEMQNVARPYAVKQVIDKYRKL